MPTWNEAMKAVITVAIGMLIINTLKKRLPIVAPVTNLITEGV